MGKGEQREVGGSEGSSVRKLFAMQPQHPHKEQQHYDTLVAASRLVILSLGRWRIPRVVGQLISLAVISFRVRERSYLKKQRRKEIEEDCYQPLTSTYVQREREREEKIDLLFKV